MWVEPTDRDAATNQRELDRLLGRLVAIGGSDLHVKAGARPRVRLDGELVQLAEEPPVDAESVESFLRAMLNEQAWSRFERQFATDLAYSAPGLGRFRVNAYRQRGSIGLVLHHVATGPPTLGELQLPDSVRRLAEERRGIVLVGGPARSGRTTTVTAIVDHINSTRECHVVTIEDPVHVLHRDRLASISQREIGFDTDDAPGAVRAAMRQDADVIVMGELRDPAMAAAALDAAEAGCLVISTIRAADAASAVNGFVDHFPGDGQPHVRRALAMLLRGTICQRLVPAPRSERRVAVEVMVVNARIREHIIEADQASRIAEVIAAEDSRSMQTFAQSLYSLLLHGVIDAEVAMAAAPNPHELQQMLEVDGTDRALLGSLNTGVELDRRAE